VFSLWDTYRATHPLYTIIEQERTNDFINTLLAKYDEGGILPIWDLSSNYTDCMIGYHAVPVIADAYLKGIRGYDTEKAFQAMKHSAFQDKLGLKSYKEFGFVPMEEESESVSKTLEYAYDDWTIAQMAKAMDKEDDYALFSKRAQFYKNVYDPETQFMRGRFRNTWFTPFDPYEVNFNYTEANAWQYSLYAPQDITGLMNLIGGKKALENHLDNLFTAKNETSGRDQIDITGLIGQYAHGNEPSHHMAYLYNFVNKPAKTQEKVYQILTELYKNDPDGVSGNEDCGQMSAWYVTNT
jgi:predicted alpha-1,2-mannosidase